MIIVGHRGARGLAPENTIAGLTKALEYHADMVEFDLRVTKDGVVVLYHNPELIDATGNKLDISENSYGELKKHKPNLATFEEALDAIGPDFPKYIEVKPNEPIQPIVKIIKQYIKKDWPSENFLLASFSQKTLLALQKELPDIQKGVLEKWFGCRAQYRARQLNTRLLIVNQHNIWFGFVAAVSRAGYTLYTFTLNDPKKTKRWEKHGLAGVVTDYPDRFKHRS